MPIADYICEHGVRHGDPIGEPTTWNGPVGKCTCCGHNIFYIDSFNFNQKGSSSRYWTPKNRCYKCGGGYKEEVTLTNENS